MSSKKKTEIENSVGPGNGQQDVTKKKKQKTAIKYGIRIRTSLMVDTFCKEN